MTVKTSVPQVSIKEIAEVAGVHRSTASKVLNNHANFKINQATRRRILKVADELGFEKNNHFVAPTGVKSFGFLNFFQFNKKFNPFYSDTFDGIDSEARAQRFNVYLINNMERMNLVQLLQQEGFLGVITVGVDRSLLTSFEYTKKPVVAIEAPHHLDSSVLFTVRTDSEGGTYAATKFLIGVGHKRIYYLGFRPHSNSKEDLSSLERSEGVVKALREAGLYVGDRRIIVAQPQQQQGHEEEAASAIDMGFRAMNELLNRKPEFPIACVCYSDLHAEGAYRAIAGKKLRIPEDISVIGYDNISRSQELRPALTTIDVPRLELGKQAVRTLIDVEQGIAEHETILPNYLVIRDSVLEII